MQFLSCKYILLIEFFKKLSAILLELVYLMKSIWKGDFYYLFGFLLLIMIIQMVISSQIAIIITYIQLCRKNYRWWWKSFVVSGSSAVWIFIYSFYYYLDILKVKLISGTILYFGYMIILSFSLFIVSGSVGVLVTFFFLKKIYSLVKLN